MDKKSAIYKDLIMSPQQISFYLKKTKRGQLSFKKSPKKKNIKGKKKLKDIPKQILQSLNFENFEQESEKFYPQVFRRQNKIYIDDVSLLDQSHFRFLVKQNGDIFNHYTLYKQNNFQNIFWKDIELIYFYCSEDYSCPICLEPKLCCPVITKCGHVFCFPCIVSLYNYHMKNSENKKMPNCPLCSKKIEITSEDGEINIDSNGIFKLCQKVQTKNYRNNMKIKFNLILRDKKSPTLYNLIYDPNLDNWKNNFKSKMRQIPSEQTKEFNFSRVLYENKLLIEKRLINYKNDLNALKKLYDFTSDELKKKSIQECIKKIDLHIFKNKKEDNNNILIHSKKLSQINISDNEDDTNLDIDYKKYFLFYQEEKGDIYYLDPFIMEILLTEYEDYNSLPVELEGDILDIKMTQVTAKLKSEYKYLNHLRIGAIIFFVEIDINGLISSSTKDLYKDKLNERSRIRNLLKNQEKNYEEYINKRNIKLIEEEKNSPLQKNKIGLQTVTGPMFMGLNDELIKPEDKEQDKKNEEKEEKKVIKVNKLKLLFKEKEMEDIKKKEKRGNTEKKIKRKKGGIKKVNKDNKEGKKKETKGVKEKVFNSDNEGFFSDGNF